MSAIIKDVFKQARQTFTAFTNNQPEVFEKNLNNLCTLMDRITATDLNLDISYAQYIPQDQEKCAPISYIEVYEDKIISIGIFVLKPHKIVPLHNHPEMYGIIKVLAGQVSVESYSLNTSKTLEVDMKLQHRDIPIKKQDISTSTTNIETSSSTKDVALQIKPSSVDASTSTTTLSSTGSDHNHNRPPGAPLRRVISAEFKGKDLVNAASKPCVLQPKEYNIHEIRSYDEPAAFLDILAPPYYTEIPTKGPRLCSYFSKLGFIEENVCLLEEVGNPSFYWTDSKPYLGPDPRAD